MEQGPVFAALNGLDWYGYKIESNLDFRNSGMKTELKRRIKHSLKLEHHICS